MFQNYFKIALRNLWRYPAFSGINVLGLAIGFQAINPPAATPVNSLRTE
ncbi:MAG: hypothetical protein M3142_04790 [Bacteroidota bacterium]|nr:hypothetical protein [Bacteroidota bacterium]